MNCLPSLCILKHSNKAEIELCFHRYSQPLSVDARDPKHCKLSCKRPREDKLHAKKRRIISKHYNPNTLKR